MTKEKENNLSLVEALEQWRIVSGYEGLYEISSFGLVRSLDRYTKKARGRRFVKGRILKPKLDKDGYLMVCLCNDGIEEMIYIHRLVALLFLDNSNKFLEVNHIDGIKSNNHLLNLEWCTRYHNMQHASKMGLLKRNVKNG